PASPDTHPECDTPSTQRNAEVTVVAVTVNVAIEHYVPGDPASIGAALHGACVLGRHGLQPELNGVVGRTYIGRAGRSVDGNHDAVKTRGVDAVTVEAQRVARSLSGRRQRRDQQPAAGIKQRR